jgi:hypothetical protein
LKLSRGSPYLLAVLYATAYGLGMRFITMASRNPGSTVGGASGLASGGVGVLLFGVMTLSFLVIVPFVIGFFSVRLVSAPRIWHALFGGWPACILSIVVTFVVGWEGSICILMGSPLMLVVSTVGGLVAWSMRNIESRAVTYSALALPLAFWPLEHALGIPTSLRTVRSEIAIQSTPTEVWSRIVTVPTIGRDELRPSLATRLGFPRPIEATLDRPGIGGVRRATFEGGILFLETIDEWEPERRLSFSIAAQTDSIPPTTLDEHVTIGGPYFDVLEGTYTIEPRSDGVVLHLESRVRVSTTFNLYAGPWADALMGSIQEQILAVLKRRCEAGGAVGR